MAASGDREKHLGRFASVVLVLMMLTSMLAWLAPASAQPMCPFDTIWDAEAETCVPLEPTETPEPTPTTEVQTPEPTEEDMAPTEEPAVETPADAEAPEGEESPEMTATLSGDEAETPSAEFSIFGWDPFSFEGPIPAVWIALYSCGRAVHAGDTFDSLMPNCWYFFETSAAMGFNVYHNGQFVETLGAGEFTASGTDLPAGEVSIQAFYPDDFAAPWADCHVYYMDDDDPVVTYRYPWVPQGRAMLTLPVEKAGSSVACVWFFPPNTVMHVDAYAYTCPAYVTDQTIQYDDLIVRCPGSSETEMQILSEGGIQNRIADAGWAPFHNVPVGTLQIRGFPPPGYGDPLVYCMMTGPGGQTTKGLDLEIIGNQGYVTIENNPPGGVIRCDFFFRET